MKPVNYSKLSTEQENPLSRHLDRLSIEEILQLMSREDQQVPLAVRKESKNIARAIEIIVQSLKSGGRIFFAGAGTSGRLGVIESAELPPTFGTPPQMAQALMAGGKKAVFRSQEGAEDNAPGARREVARIVNSKDVVIGIAASGVTPYVRAALEQAKKMKAGTVLITCSLNLPFKNLARVVIAPYVGPEIIAGSTRLKSGTATKMVLNMLTAISMVQMGKVIGNKMVDLQPKSNKLRERGIHLVQELGGVSRNQAQRTLQKARWQVKAAILMAKKNLTFSKAESRLRRADGFLGRALAV